MGNQNYVITDTELLKEGGEECFDNARTHFDAAKLLSEKEMYGLACSHLVLAAEEASKAYILLARAIMGNKEKKNFKDFFTQHKVKQDLAHGFSVFVKLIDTMYQNLFKWQLELDPDDLTEEELVKMKKEQNKRVKNHMKWLKAQMEDKSEMDNLSNWWQQANQLKNIGFYVDYHSSSWQTPQRITSVDYEESVEIINMILETLAKFRSIVNEQPEKLKEYYEDFLKSMNKDVDDSE